MPAVTLITRDDPAGLGYVLRPMSATGTAVSFPVGTAAGYAPVSLSSSGTAAVMKVRTFGGVLENGTNGAPYASTSRFVNRSWEIMPLAAGAIVDMTLQWNGTNENTSFQRSGAKIYHNDNASGGWAALPSTTAMGTNPYQVTAAGVSSFSTFAVGSAGPLPVELVSFGAQRASATAVLVAWATVTEINCGHFDIERSADGQQFQRFGAVACGGSSSQSRAYTFRDEAAAGAAYYRLHQVDTDGQAQYSPVVYVAGLGATGLALSIFPNPTTGTVTLVGAPAATPLLLSLRNALGQVVLPACPATGATANELLSATLAHCPPGVYVLTAECQGQRQHLKVIKQ
jgi:hypothetical protein